MTFDEFKQTDAWFIVICLLLPLLFVVWLLGMLWHLTMLLWVRDEK
jgi:hypothetical protein